MGGPGERGGRPTADFVISFENGVLPEDVERALGRIGNATVIPVREESLPPDVLNQLPPPSNPHPTAYGTYVGFMIEHPDAKDDEIERATRLNGDQIKTLRETICFNPADVLNPPQPDQAGENPIFNLAPEPV